LSRIPPWPPSNAVVKRTGCQRRKGYRSMNRQQVRRAGGRWVADVIMRGRGALRLSARVRSGQPFSAPTDALPGDDRRQGATRTRATTSVAPPKGVALVLLPPLLLASTVLAYRWLSARLGPKLGYFAGFLFYWASWCLLVPLWVLGPRGLRDLFRDVRPRVGRPTWVGLFCLVLPPLVGYFFAFPRQLRTANRRIVVASAALALVNTTLEEFLWRGAYAAHHDRYAGSPGLGGPAWYHADVGEAGRDRARPGQRRVRHWPWPPHLGP
jgi:hypothetical protein